MKKIDLYLKTPSEQALKEDLKRISPNFVTKDEKGDEILVKFTSQWAIDYIGPMIKTPETFDEEGNIITPAEYYQDGDRVNLRLIGDRVIGIFTDWQKAGGLSNMESGSSFVSPAPETPERKFA